MSNMLRRRLFVLGIISIAAGITAIAAENANRKFVVARGARIDCTDDTGGMSVGTLCRRAQTAEIDTVQRLNVSSKHNEFKDRNELVNEDADPSEENVNGQTELEEARGKKKKRGYLKIFFMMAAAAKATLLYAMIHAVALVAGKALVVAKVALALAAAVALKKALEHKESTSYEIVKHPHHSYSQTHSASVDYDHHGGGGGYEGGHRRRRRHAR